jgi:hypothetical protein
MKAINGVLLRSACCAVLLAAPEAAWAQGRAAAAEALFEQGRQEMKAGDYDAACGKFKESDRLDPAVGTKFNLAHCEEARGRLAAAWELYKTVESRLDASDKRYGIARERREAIQPRLPKLKLSLAEGAPDATVVRIGELELGKATFGVPLPLDPGEHELVVSAPEHAERKVTVVAKEGETTEVVVGPGERAEPGDRAEPGKADAVAPTPTVGEGRPRDVGVPSRGTPTLGYVIGGVGVVGIAVGGITGVMALGKASTAHDHCWEGPPQGCDQEGVDANSSGQTLAAVSTVGFVVGLVGVGLGTYFILTSGDGGKTETALVTRAYPSGGQVSLVQHW